MSTRCGHSEKSQEWQDYGEHPGEWIMEERFGEFTQKLLNHSLNWSRLPQEADRSEPKMRTISPSDRT